MQQLIKIRVVPIKKGFIKNEIQCDALRDGGHSMAEYHHPVSI